MAVSPAIANIGVQLIAESLFRCGKVRIFDVSCICRENRRACKSEYMILFEIPDDRRVHIAELTAVTFVEYHHHVVGGTFNLFFLLQQGAKLLYGGDYDALLV